MEPAASLRFDSEALKGVIGKIGFLFPDFKRPVCNFKGKIGFAVIKHRLINKPLMAHPDVAVPVSVLQIIGSAHINSADSRF